MIPQNIKTTLKDKLKNCDKEILIDIIADLCNMYIGARLFIDMSNANNIQTHVQKVDNFIAQRINTNFKKI